MSAVVGSGGILAGLDVGGTKIAVLLSDLEMRARGGASVATGGAGGARLVGLVVDALDRALTHAGLAAADLAAIGVGVPGRVDTATGTVSSAVNLGWVDFAVGSRLEARFGAPVRVENDVRAAAAGLVHRRALGDVRDLAYLSVGTGIAAGVVLDGRLHRGIHGLAGEIGHVAFSREGPRCTCGLTGCLEALASGPAIARAAAERIAGGEPSSLGALPPGTLDAVAVHEAAAGGDRLALDVVNRAGVALARAIHWIAMTYDVRRIVLGGGVASAGPTFLEPITAELDRFRAASTLASEALPRDLVELLPRDAAAGAWGAITLAHAALPPRATPSPIGREVADA